MFDRVIAEKKLLAIINATVSHEMRNPINSIRSQLI
jgi:signal transduction histidine kinase